jgi:hypothetical protein
MSHARQAIREAVATAVTGLASTGARVFQSRMRAQEDLPCLQVATNGEEISREDLDALEERDLEVEIIGVAKAAGDVDDDLDDIAAEVETAIGANNTLGGRVKRMHLTGIRIEFDDELEQPVGLIRLTYRCTYFTNAGVPGTTL